MDDQTQPIISPTQPVVPAVTPPTPVITTPNKPSFLKTFLITVGLILFGGLLGVLASRYLPIAGNGNTQQEVVAPITIPTEISTITPTATPTIDLTANWKTYDSPKTDFSSQFQIKYPSSWNLKETYSGSEGDRSLSLSLTNSILEKISIYQGETDGGVCLYSEDSDYKTYDGMGSQYFEYIQLNKPMLWRISKSAYGNVYGDDSPYSHTVCQMNTEMKRYISLTSVGTILIKLKSAENLPVVASILETIIIKK
jgi:hypothetical protein